jgi:hypothetical protein
MVSNKQYVAGWFESSIHDFLQLVPTNSNSTKFALITCLDSNLAPKSLLKKSPELRSLGTKAHPLGKALLLPTRQLIEADSKNQLFFGFDEVWFFSSDQIGPKPNAAWLVGPARIDQHKLDKIAGWMSDNSCSLALGDGEGLNFIVKAHGLVKKLLGHSIDQPRLNAAFAASPIGAVAV